MPRYASNGLFHPPHPALRARFRAAENPLRIPKVREKAARDRILPCPKYTVLLTLFDVLPG